MNQYEEDTRPTHPRTVTSYSGEQYRVVLSPRAMRAVTADRRSWQDVADDCRDFRAYESREQFLLDLAANADGYEANEGGWSDYADAVAAAEEVTT